MDTPPQSDTKLQSGTQQKSQPATNIDMNSEQYHHGKCLTQANYIQLADLPLTPIDPHYPKLLLIISSTIVFTIDTALMIILFIAQPLPINMSLVITPLIILISLGIIKLIHLKATKISYGLFRHELVLREGLFWISTTALPYTRLQHVNLSQGPAERKFNLVTLKCFSAGSGVAEIDLPGINAELAEHIRQHLLSRASATHQQSLSDTNMSEIQQSPPNTAPRTPTPHDVIVVHNSDSAETIEQIVKYHPHNEDGTNE